MSLLKRQSEWSLENWALTGLDDSEMRTFDVGPKNGPLWMLWDGSFYQISHVFTEITYSRRNHAWNEDKIAYEDR